MTTRIALAWIGTLLLAACSNERIDTTSIAQEMKDREIKHVSSAQIMALGDDWGKEIAKVLKSSPKGSLLGTSLTDSLAKSFSAEITFVTPKNFSNPSLPDLQQQVLGAYLYNVSHQVAQSDNIQRMPDQKTLLFTSPVLWSADFEKFSKAEQAMLGQRYQLDSLSFRKKGDLLGVWCIKLPKKEIIRRTDTKALKKLKNRVAE
ncbi:MAG: hypothetical protein U0Y10_03835 [Spirosomataceae bacterium]